MDMENVIKGLECCSIPQGRCRKCPYETEGFVAECTSELAKDALALLKGQQQEIWELQDQVEYLTDKQKEQEAVKPKSKVRHGANAQIQHFCGYCNSMLHGKPKYCSECGKGVLW